MTEATSTISAIIGELGAKGKLTKADKNWLTKRFDDIIAHERNMEILNLLVTDPDAFYKLLFLGGMGIMAIGAAFAIIPTITPDTDVFPDGLVVGGFLLIPAGMVVSVFAAIMLFPRRVFGDNGIQFEIEGGIDIWGGASGSIKVG